jgi:hypothetical protein
MPIEAVDPLRASFSTGRDFLRASQALALPLTDAVWIGAAMTSSVHIVVLVWFVVAVVVEVMSSEILRAWLRRRGVDVPYARMPGRLERAYLQYSQAQGRSGRLVVGLRRASMINVVLAFFAALPFLTK